MNWQAILYLIAFAIAVAHLTKAIREVKKLRTEKAQAESRAAHLERAAHIYNRALWWYASADNWSAQPHKHSAAFSDRGKLAKLAIKEAIGEAGVHSLGGPDA